MLEEQADPNRIGQLAARNRGVVVEIFAANVVLALRRDRVCGTSDLGD